MRTVYDRRTVEILSIGRISKQHPDWSDEEKCRVGRLEENVAEQILILTTRDFAAKIMEDYDENLDWEQCVRKAKNIIDNIEPSLIQNINEWIDGVSLSEIKVHGWSINDVMNQFGEVYPITFIHAIECFVYWKETNYSDKNFCRMFFPKK